MKNALMLERDETEEEGIRRTDENRARQQKHISLFAIALFAFLHFAKLQLKERDPTIARDTHNKLMETIMN